MATNTRYSDADLYRVASILLAKEAGSGLADIRSMLAAGTAAVRHEVTARHCAVLRERIARAQAALAMIEGGLKCRHDDLMACENFRGLIRGVPGCEDLPPPRS